MAFEFTPSRKGGQIALNALTGKATVTSRKTYLALLLSEPTATTTLGTMDELEDDGYARQEVTWNAPTEATPPASTNDGDIDFGPFVANPDPIVAVALVSADEGTTGDFLGWWDAGSLDSEPGNILRIADGKLSLSAS